MKRVIGYCLIVLCVIFGLGSKFAFATPLPIVATTCEVTDVTSNSATSHGKITSSAGEQLVTVWFKYGTARDNYTSTSTSITQSVSSGTTKASIEISELSPNTTYYYRIVGQSNEFGESTGREKSFTTLSETPTATGTPTPFSTSDCSNCTISGKVINAITKKGIKNAWIIGTSSYIATTDEDGYYSWYDDDENRLQLCCGGAYTLTTSADGYESLTQLIEIDPCISSTLDFELQPMSTSITPTPAVTPTPTSKCEVKSIEVLPKRLKLKRGQSSEVDITLGGDSCTPAGKTVTATIGKFGSNRILISSMSEVTDENGEAKFIVTAKDKIGNAKVIFKVGSLKKSIIVKVRS